MTQEQFHQMMNTWLTSRAELTPDAWSAGDRQWAESAGIIQGDENGNKKYKSFVTREEVITILHRAVSE